MAAAVPSSQFRELLAAVPVRGAEGVAPEAASPSDPWSSQPQLLPLAAQTQADLEQLALELRDFLAANPVDMADVARALQQGSGDGPYRRMIVCSGREDALAAFGEKKSQRLLSGHVEARRTPVLLLPGIGDHYVGMGHGLYVACDVFREAVDQCAWILEPLLGVDIRHIIHPASESWKQIAQAQGINKGIDLKRMLGRAADDPPDDDTIRLNATFFSQPALFTIEYAMARLWASLGVTPGAIIGHSMGEYVAACLAGVLSLEDALRLIAVRAKLVDALPQAVMLAVMLPEAELLPQLPADLCVSLVNGPSHCVIAGPPEPMAAFERALTERAVIARRVQNGHAFHTRLMDPVVREFEAEVAKARLSPPRIPYISNVTGTWITAADATDPSYWVRHLTQTARFNEALHELWQLPDPMLIECGPGRTLTVLANQHPERKGPLRGAIGSIRQRYENESDLQVLLGAVGRTWIAGTSIRWEGLPRESIVFASPPDSYWSAPHPSTPTATDIAITPATEIAAAPATDDAVATEREKELLAIWSRALGRDNIGVDDSFGALGGDSLSSIAALVEMKRVGVPDSISRGLYGGLTIRQMVREEEQAGGASHQVTAVNGIPLGSVETPVFLRAFGIYLVLAGHFGLASVNGNTVLMAVSGLSFAKFQLRTIAKERNVLPVFRFGWKIALPSMIETLARQLAHHAFHPVSLLFIDNLRERDPFGLYESPYYIDLLLEILLLAALPLSIPQIRRWAVEKPLACAMTALLFSWLGSILVPLFFDPGHSWILVPQAYTWLFAAGWCAAYSRTRGEKILLTTTLLCLDLISDWVGQRMGWHGFLARGLDWYALLTMVVLVWFDEIPAQIPNVLVRAINAVAAASLFIYLTNYSFKHLFDWIWRHLPGTSAPEFPPLLLVPIAMAGGYLVWRLWEYAMRRISVQLGRTREAGPAPATGSW
ncbi:MAG TPA: acyltransferase domain-containing protein [Steroidobacteraceae bacterium]|jgi:malonyl CoA-acyl carrier protein transacylase|nr:acyltransferase domain-containing protein [Steroidobacteraceae bacterium]